MTGQAPPGNDGAPAQDRGSEGSGGGKFLKLNYNLSVTDFHGVRAAVLTPAIPDDAPEQVREGLARRAIVNNGGVCPCGATLQLNRAQRRKIARGKAARFLSAAVAHEDDCPATDEAILAALRGAR